MEDLKKQQVDGEITHEELDAVCGGITIAHSHIPQPKEPRRPILGGFGGVEHVHGSGPDSE